MIITIDRKYKKSTYTIGKLYVNGKYFCDTLEDKDRSLNQDMTEEQVRKIKVKGKTAIPTGTYKVTLNVQSPKYKAKSTWYSYNKGYMPRILNVKGFDGILIHSGNTEFDTEGCILVGKNTVVGKVTDSTNTFKRLYELMKSEKDDITLKIE